MAGWVKLWRKMKDNGHLKMPGNALKLWIYCLLEAAPYPEPARELKAGELWLNYEHVRQMIGTDKRQMSKSTVSGALKYLQDNGYLTLQAKQFYGVKACVVNWRNYQSGTETVPAAESTEGPSSTETVPVTVPGEGPSGTETVPAAVPVEGLSSTDTVPVDSLSSTVTVPVPVLVRSPRPYSGAASEEPKNIKNKELKNKDLAAAIAHEFAKEFGRTLSPLEVSQLAVWQKDFSHDLIKEALARAVLKNNRNLAYIGGILTSWRQSGIGTVEAARQEKPRHSCQAGGKGSPAARKEFIKSLYL